jgi:ATP-dependent RNA helicase RhlE
MSFQSFNLDSRLLSGIRDLGFSEPTPVQRDAIPPAMAGRDVLACAMTGSGKTAAFLLPILQRLQPQPRGSTRALILSPTRELAAQIHEHFEALSKHSPVRGAAVFGGVGMGPQEHAFRRGVDVIVATPGRLLDHMQYPYVDFSTLEVLVLDEADRMLDMGFLPAIRRVLRQLPADRQTLFFSATIPAPIVQLSREMLREPAQINMERKAAPATGITQAVYPVAEDLKPALLLDLLRSGTVGNAIVFCRTKHRANRLADILEKNQIPSARIHGNRSQNARTDALGGFKSGRYRILVATDIVARGIDVEALEHVVNFDVPVQAEDYIHRVGRTARAEATGDAYTLVAPEEEKELKNIERAIGKSLRRVKVDGFDYSARPTERFEVPIGERIAEIRRRKAEERQRARAKAELKAQRASEEAAKQEARSRGGAGYRSGPTSGSSAPSREPALAGGSNGRRGRRRAPHQARRSTDR